MKFVDKIIIGSIGAFALATFVSFAIMPDKGETGMAIMESAKQRYLNGEVFASEDMYTIPEEIIGRYTRDGVVKALDESFRGGLLHGMGSLVVESVEYQKYQQEYGLDTLEWALKIGSIIKLESRTNINGRWVIATSYNCKTNNNICGMNVRTANSDIERYNLKWNGERVDYEWNGRYTKYPSIAESLRDLAYWLKVRYIMNDLKTLPTIGDVYAPTNDVEEGTNGMSNAKWSSNVTKFYNELVLRAEVLSK